jgi:type II secretory pathway pseudopilin PulG
MKQFPQSGLIQNSCGKNGRNSTRQQSGYILLMMMLFIALMAIAALAALPSMEMQVKRDREEEMIHRGAQYARAIRHYVKKFGRYPTSIADLQDTNDVHFLRKAYKDPITGKDFRLLHMGDVQMLMGGAGFGGGTFTGNPGAAAGAGQPGMPVGVPITSSNTSSGAVVQPDNSGTPDSSGTNTNGDNSSAGSADGQSSDGQSSNASSSNGSSSNGPSGGPGGQVFGGGPIMGVASASKDKTIRKFNNKEHYNEWLFVYDPTNDRALITGPYQPTLMGQGIGQPIGGANGSGMQNTPGTGNQVNTGFGMQPMQPQNPGMNPSQH